MEQGQGVEVIGYRWISNRGPNACRNCASLHGREFYHRPKAGQLSVSQMPTPPLHPNCRCTREEIVELNINPIVVEPKPDRQEYGPAESEYAPATSEAERKRPKPILTEHDGEGGVVWFGLKWGSGGISVLQGPQRGYYGGGHWSKGVNTEDMTDQEIEALPEPEPIDMMDRATQIHDRGHRKCRRTNLGSWENFRCNYGPDKALYHAALSLPRDPDDWGRGPMSVDERRYALTYRDAIILLFGFKVVIGDLITAVEDMSSMFEGIDPQSHIISP